MKKIIMNICETIINYRIFFSSDQVIQFCIPSQHVIRFHSFIGNDKKVYCGFATNLTSLA